MKITRGIKVSFLVYTKGSLFKRSGCAETPVRLSEVSQGKMPVLSLSFQMTINNLGGVH
jgi:hypothetical protein